MTVFSPNKGYKIISQGIANGHTSIETSFPRGYNSIMVQIDNLKPSSDNVIFTIKTSSDGGVTFDSTLGDYKWLVRHSVLNTTEVQVEVGQNNGDSISTFRNVGNATNESSSIILNLQDISTTKYTKLLGNGLSINSSGEINMYDISGIRLEAGIVNSIKFAFSVGNIATGNFKIYGIK